MTVRAKRLSPSGKPSAPSSCESIPHCDHVGAAAPVINAMPVGIIFDSGQAYSGRAYRDALAAAGSHHVRVVLARRGMQWTSGDGVTLEVLAPSTPFLADTGDDVNENSIVVILRAYSFRELFMGDAGEASEARLLAAGIDLRADAGIGATESQRVNAHHECVDIARSRMGKCIRHPRPTVTASPARLAQRAKAKPRTRLLGRATPSRERRPATSRRSFAHRDRRRCRPRSALGERTGRSRVPSP